MGFIGFYECCVSPRRAAEFFCSLSKDETCALDWSTEKGVELHCPLEECHVFSGPSAKSASLPEADTDSWAWLECTLEARTESFNLRAAWLSLCSVLSGGFILLTKANTAFSERKDFFRRVWHSPTTLLLLLWHCVACTVAEIKWL